MASRANGSTHTQTASKKSSSLNLSEIFDDLCVRFIVNLPEESFESFERLFFAIESAHWFYDDFYREDNPNLPRLPLKQFAARIFEQTALLAPYLKDVGRLVAKFQSYKQEVPTCGAAMLNARMDRVVLVRGWGRDAKWGFPKGKVAKDESELACAIREVEEETGFDMTPLVSDSSFYIDSFVSGRYSRIYVVPNVPEDVAFSTQTRKEISDIRWVALANLPESPKAVKLANRAAAANGEHSRMLFSLQSLAPFTKRLRSWVARQRNAPDPTAAPPNTSPNRKNLQSQSSPPRNPIAAPHTDRDSAARKRSGKRGSRRGKDNDSAARARDHTTFGHTAHQPLTDVDRRRLFKQYVQRTDKIAKQNGLHNEFWPVPCITSRDFSDDSDGDGEVDCDGKRTVATNDVTGRGDPKPPDWPDVADVQPAPFAFDRKAILRCMLSLEPS